MLEIKVLEQKIETIIHKDHTRGTVGAQVKITFDDFWADYEKKVVFKRCYNSLNDPVPVLVSGMSVVVEIPPEILAESGKYKIGVIGIKDGIVLPTLYSEEFNSLYATDTKGLKSADEYTPSEIDQLRLLKQDKLTAGNGISIDENNVIAVTTHGIEKGIEITYDGDISEYTNFVVDEGLSFVKVSDTIPTIEELNGGTLTITENGEVIEIIEEINESYIEEIAGAYAIAFAFAIVIYDADTFLANENGTPEGLTNGTYFMHYDDGDNLFYCSGLAGAQTIKKLDEKFLPDISIVAKTGSYNDLKNKPEIYSADEVDAKIDSINVKFSDYETKTKTETETETGNLIVLRDIVDPDMYDIAIDWDGDHNVNTIIGTGIAYEYDSTTTDISVIVGGLYYEDNNGKSYSISNGSFIAGINTNLEIRAYSDCQNIPIPLQAGVCYYISSDVVRGSKVGFAQGHGDIFEYHVKVAIFTEWKEIRVSFAIDSADLYAPTSVLYNSMFPITATHKIYDNIVALNKQVANDTTLSIKDTNDGLPTPIPPSNRPSITAYWDGTTATSFSSTAAGTENDPIIINTAAELAYLVTLGNSTKGKYYKIADGITEICLQSLSNSSSLLSASSADEVKKFFTIGYPYNEWPSRSGMVFSGNFDGNGATIYGMYIKNASYCGLFGATEGSVAIKNISIKNSYLKTGWYAGAITNKADGALTVENCVVAHCCMIGNTGVTTIPNQCLGIMIGRASTDNDKSLVFKDCLIYDNNISYEHDSSSHNYLIGVSTKTPNIKNSVILDCEQLVCANNSVNITNVYTKQDVSVDDIKCEKAITKTPALDWGVNWFIPTSYEEQAVPFSFLQLAQQSLSRKINNNETEISQKKITSIVGQKEEFTFEYNSLYLIVSNSGNADITLYDSSTGAVVKDGDGNNLPASKMCILILPESTSGISGKQCYFIGMTGTFSIVNPNILKGLQFAMPDGADVYFTQASKTATIYKIGF